MGIVSRRAGTCYFIMLLGCVISAGETASPAAAAEKAASDSKLYTATASLELSPNGSALLTTKNDLAEFEVFRETQIELLRSRYVIAAAIRDPKIHELPSIRREDARHHATAWLAKEIRVACPGNSRLLTVSLTSGDPKETAALVNAVVRAFLGEVVDAQRLNLRQRLSNIEQLYGEKESGLRAKRAELKREWENTGAADAQTTAARTRLATEIYGELRRECLQMRAERRTLDGKLQLARMELSELSDRAIPEIKVAARLTNSPVYRDLQSRVAMLQLLQPGAGAPLGTKQAPKSERAQSESAAAREEIKKLEDSARDQIRDALRVGLTTKIRRLEIRLTISEKQLALSEKEVERQRHEIDALERSSVAVEMIRAEIQSLERIFIDLAAERERLSVELRAQPRVRVLGDAGSPAQVPECPD